MKKYNIQNYNRYKEDLKNSMPDEKFYDYYTRDELIIKFLPLVENIARKFSTNQQASGVLTINDLIQEGSYGLTAAVDKLNWDLLIDSEDIEKTLKSFFSKRIKGAIRRAVDINRGNIKIPEYILNDMRRNSEKNKKTVEMFFNSIFKSIDENNSDYYNDIEDKSKEYNEVIFNKYLDSLFKKHLTEKEFYVIKHSFGLGVEKLPAKEIADKLKINVGTAQIRVSQIKRDAINKLIDNVDHSQVVDFL
jgi:RNA polymerase sigma factor (sigma-70 family)